MQLEVRLKQFWKNTRGHDFLEYALMAGFLVVTAAAVMPSVASSIVTISARMHVGHTERSFKQGMKHK
jgi:hypothetical protein